MVWGEALSWARGRRVWIHWLHLRHQQGIRSLALVCISLERPHCGTKVQCPSELDGGTFQNYRISGMSQRKGIIGGKWHLFSSVLSSNANKNLLSTRMFIKTTKHRQPTLE